MKKLFLSLLACAMITGAYAQQLSMPASSPLQTVKQDFGLSSVELSYSRPAMKGRTIMGDLVPYDKVWRTGANAATTITFGDDVTFGGKAVKAGKYGLLTIPGESAWAVILTSDLDVTSPSAYKPENDVVRVKVQPEKLPFTVESFLISFEEVLPASMTLMLVWEKTAVPVKIETEIDERIMAQIDKAMQGEKKPYFQAAFYYLEAGKDLDQALEWFDKAIEENKEAFWIYHQKAKALAELGRKEDAKETAEKSIELAKAARNNDYVLLNEKLIAEL